MKKFYFSFLLLCIFQNNFITISAQLYWSESFGSYAVGQNIHSSNGWNYQNSSVDNTGYKTQLANPLTYGKNLQSDAAYFTGGYAYTNVGVAVPVLNNAFSLAYYADVQPQSNTNVAGYKANGSNEFWYSMLVRADQNGSFECGFHSMNTTWMMQDFKVKSDNGLWSLSIDGVLTSSGITTVKGKTALIVCKLNFEIDGTRLSLYVNPILGVTPTTANATGKSAVPQYFNSIAFYLGNGPANISIDELHIGATYADVTPLNAILDLQAPTIPTTLSSSNINDSSFDLSWTASTDNAGVNLYEVYKDGLLYKTSTTSSSSISGLVQNSSYAITIKARDADGNLSGASLPLNVTTLPKRTVATAVTIDKNVKHQTMDGFGFFGPMHSWWDSSDPNYFSSNAWLDYVISDLGITIWRNEWYPPKETWDAGQDADWTKQKVTVQNLKAKADQLGVNVKFIVTIWSPPAADKWWCSFSWAGDAAGKRGPGGADTNFTWSTKNGGTLNPGKYTDYANWLKTCVSSYSDAGVKLYGLSLQNELAFSEGYNSCTYTTTWYNDLLNNVVPQIKSTYPDVKIYGAENMLDMEGKDINWPYFYHAAIKNDATAKNNIDILAVHGYTDGVVASSGSNLSKYWTNHKEQFSKPMNKQAWMTETSGYGNFWKSNGNTPGALALASDILSGLVYGDMSGWVYWYGSAGDLMDVTTPKLPYFASKQFFRYIRPGAVRVDASSENAEIAVGAFENTAMGTNTIVLINTANIDNVIDLKGISGQFEMFVSSETNKCVSKGMISSTSSITLPALSVVTLISGGTALSSGTINSVSNPLSKERVNLTIFPNPTIDKLNLNFGSQIESASISIVDLQGRKMINKSTGNTQIENLDISSLRSGIYFVKVIIGNKTLNTKFVKK